MNRYLILCAICMISANSQVLADEPVATGAEVFKGYDIYATTIIREDTVWKQWFAGWMSEADKPWDRMYYSFSKDSGLSWSTPLEIFTVENVQVNDPSVLRLWDAENDRYYYQMYYTWYPSGQGDPTNYIAVSTSLDGIDWTHHGVLIGADNGIDMDGAWAPSAWTADSLAGEVYLYFHNNDPDGRVFRTTLSNKGMDFDPASTSIVTAAGGLRANVDVSRDPEGTWWMFYNGSSLTSGGKGNFNTCKMHSEDGLNWIESSHNPIQEYGNMTTTTPHVLWTDSSSYQLWYGYGTPSFLDFDVYVQFFQLEAELELSVVASSEALEVLGAPMAVDGDPSTIWSSAGHAGSGNFPEWIYLDQGESGEISVMEVMPRIAEGAAMCFPLDFKIQHSSDALEWTDIAGQSYTDYQCTDTAAQVFRFSPVSDRYFRLHATELGADSYGNYYCQIAEISISLDTSATGIRSPEPLQDALQLYNYPNPFVHSTSITYTLPRRSHVKLSVYDLQGRLVEELLDGTREAGEHQVEWRVPGVPGHLSRSHQLLLRLQTEDHMSSILMLKLEN